MFASYSKYELIAIISFVSLLSIQMTCAQIPTIACPSYFRYYGDGTQFFGKVTLPRISEGNTKLEVHIVQRGPVPERNPAGLSLFGSQQEVSDNFINGKPITYRVDFPISNDLPKLALISVNDVVVCSDNDYPAPSYTVKLIHNLMMKIETKIVPFAVRATNSDAESANSIQIQPEKSPSVLIPRFNHPFGSGNPFLSNLSKNQPQPLTTKAENHGFHSLSKPQYIGNPFLANASKKSTPLMPPTGFITNSVVSKPNYSNNLFLSNFSKKNQSSTPPTTAPNIQPDPIQGLSGLNEVCGRENLAITPFIRGGVAVHRGEFPWLTAIYRKKGADLTFICAGSLISARTVISAAHCFVEHRLNASKTLVLLGRNNLEVVEEVGSKHRELENLILHPDYNSNAIPDADIALLHFKTPVTFSHYISPICLWNKAIDVNYIVGFTGYVAGWGADENGELVTDQPKKIETHIANDDDCKRSLRDHQTMISSHTICVRTPINVGPCTGDSGGGLAMYTDGRWNLRGIVSAGLTKHGKCVSNEFYYFCDIAKHMNWIQQNMLI